MSPHPARPSTDELGQLFDGAAESYARLTPPYPTEIFPYLGSELMLNSGIRIADLGCGPGALAIPLSIHVAEVVAIDPSADMLSSASTAANDADRGNIVFRRGRAEDLEQLASGPIQHALFGRSFHWTDRARVLADLDRLLPIGGAVALVDPSRQRDGSAVRRPWDEIADPIRRAFLGPDEESVHAAWRQRYPRTSDILSSSAFSCLSRRAFAQTRWISPGEAAAVQLSYSYSSPRLLGDRAGEFIAAVNVAIVESLGRGPFRSDESVDVVLARRPSDSS